MLKRIGACCLMVSLAALAAAQSDLPASGSHHAVPDLSTKLLRLQESAARHPDGRLLPERVAELLPELVRFDSTGAPRSIRHRQLNSLLLDEVRRLSERVAALEATEGAGLDDPSTEPLVRIRVTRHE